MGHLEDPIPLTHPKYFTALSQEKKKRCWFEIPLEDCPIYCRVLWPGVKVLPLRVGGRSHWRRIRVSTLAPRIINNPEILGISPKGKKKSHTIMICWVPHPWQQVRVLAHPNHIVLPMSKNSSESGFKIFPRIEFLCFIISLMIFSNEFLRFNENLLAIHFILSIVATTWRTI